MKSPVNHGDHEDHVWQTKSLVTLKKEESQMHFAPGQEGCLGCLTGFDADEVAVGGKEVGSNSSHGKEIIPDFSSSFHWWISMGLAFPFAFIGLAASSRNLFGCWRNRGRLLEAYQKLKKELHLCPKDHPERMKTLSAYKKTVGYSLGDTTFNIIVPGVINGLASLAVLTSVVHTLPIALGFISLYALAQLGRNIWDFRRNLQFKIKIMTNESPLILKGKRKAEQIKKSKGIFLAGNSVGFSLFSSGAIIAFLSLPLIPVAGLGLAGLSIGLGLVGLAAIWTGLSNNIGIRKYITPRNGFLGLPRSANEQDFFKNIARCSEEKKALTPLLRALRQGDSFRLIRLRRWSIVLRTGLPEAQDIPWPAFVRFWHRWFSWFWKTGSGANQLLHEFDMKIMNQHHQCPEKSRSLQILRIKQLSKALKHPVPSTLTEMSTDELLTQSWHLVEKAGLANEVVLESLSLTRHNSHHGHHGLESLPQFPGLQQEGNTWARFHFHRFLESANSQEKRQLNVAMDLFLTSTYLMRLKYQQYGSFDWLQALSKSHPINSERKSIKDLHAHLV